jgi:hypothetical protein
MPLERGNNGIAPMALPNLMQLLNGNYCPSAFPPQRSTHLLTVRSKSKSLCNPVSLQSDLQRSIQKADFLAVHLQDGQEMPRGALMLDFALKAA